MITPDETTFAYLNDKEYAPKGEALDKDLAYCKTVHFSFFRVPL